MSKAKATRTTAKKTADTATRNVKATATSARKTAKTASKAAADRRRQGRRLTSNNCRTSGVNRQAGRPDPRSAEVGRPVARVGSYACSALATFPNLVPGFGDPLGIIWWVLLGSKLVALIDAAFRPRAVFVAADKLTKPGWVLILACSRCRQIFQGWLSFFGLIGIVAAAVYLVDARPALRAAAGRGRGGWGDPPPPRPPPALDHPHIRRTRRRLRPVDDHLVADLTWSNRTWILPRSRTFTQPCDAPL